MTDREAGREIVKQTMFAIIGADVVLLILGIMKGHNLLDWLVLDALLFVPLVSAVSAASRIWYIPSMWRDKK